MSMPMEPVASDSHLYNTLASVCSGVQTLASSAWCQTIASHNWPHIPSVVAQPATYVEAAAAVKTVTTVNGGLIPVGGGTHLGWGNPPAKANLLLDLSKMNHIIEYAPADMYITVQAGCSFQHLQSELARHGQFIPVDPAISENSTVGGVVACDLPSLLRSGYGSLRDYVIGTRTLQANGDITYAGSKVMKNVAGLELPKLYTGSLGTLGVLLEVTFKVRPLPETWGLLAVPLPSWERVEDALTTLAASELEPIITEVVNAAAYVNMVGSSVTKLPNHKGPVLFIGFAGNQASVNWQLQKGQTLFAHLCNKDVLAVDWHSLYPLLRGLSAPNVNGASMVAAMMSSEVAAFCADAESICAAKQITASISARGLVGQLNLHLLPAAEGAISDTTLIDTIKALQERAHALPGSLPGFRPQARGNAVVVHAPAPVRNRVSFWGNVPHALHTMQAIKQKLDPAGMLNPGRFVGGI